MRRELCNRERWLRAGLALLLAIALTAWVMHLSMQRGRLATYPRVDDVIYMARGAELWRAGQEGWDRGGVAGVVKAVARDWRRDPPHSPWASGCAAMGFGMFGVKDWSAYVCTSVPVLAFVLACGRIGKRAGGRRVGWGWKALLLMLVGASAPFLAASVQNLKPDYCAGILGAIGMMLLLRGPLLWGSWRRLAWAGVMFGLALLAKLAMMLPTGLLCLGTVGICVVRDLTLEGAGKGIANLKFQISNLNLAISNLNFEISNVKFASSTLKSEISNLKLEIANLKNRICGATFIRTFRAFALVVGTALVVALPHYALASGHAWNYTLHVLDGESYAAPGPAWNRAMYYLTGLGGWLMLGGARTLWPLAFVIGLYAAICARNGWRRKRSIYFGAMLAATAMAWAGPTLVTAKISQFAAGFDALLWLTGIYAIAGLVRSRAAARWRLSSAAAWVAVAWLVVSWAPTFPMLPVDRGDPAWAAARARDALVRDALVRDVYAAALAAARRRWPEAAQSHDVSVVLAGSPSELGRPLMEYWAARDGIRVRVREVRRIPAVAPGNTDTPEAIASRILGDGDVVLVGEHGTSMTRQKLVTTGADEFFLEIARRHPGLVMTAHVTDPATGKVREVYRKKPR